MPIQIIDPKIFGSKLAPFTIQKWTGNAGKMLNPYYVSQGVVLPTFSYDVNRFIGVQNLNTPFEFSQNFKFYIEFKVLSNLQIASGVIKCERVGSQDPQSVKDLYPDKWPSYPDLYHIEPKDTYENGKITILSKNKKQGMAYALIGYRSDDQEPNGQAYGDANAQSSNNTTTNPPNTGAGGFSVIQCFNSDIIMVNVAINGTPCVVPMPYFNAVNHYNLYTA
jgi:hypothetical protein